MPGNADKPVTPLARCSTPIERLLAAGTFPREPPGINQG